MTTENKEQVSRARAGAVDWRGYARTAFAAAVALVSCIMLAQSALGGGHSSARSMAMSGAYTALAQGVDAVHNNPANLGLRERRQTGLELVGVGVHVNNNALTLDDYNNYTGALLTSSDKEYILGKIPAEGLELSAEVEATAMSLSLGSTVFSITGVGAVEVNMNKDILDLVLNGNTMGQEISMTGTHSDAVGYVQSGLSYGWSVYSKGDRQVSLGATGKYIKGLAVEQIVELGGGFRTLATGFEGEGHMIAQTATGGSGYGLDFGVAMQYNKDYTVGLSFRNLLSSISWSQDTEEHGYNFSFDTMTVDNMEDDYIVSDDYTKPIGGFSTNLPTVMTLGVANTTGNLVWAVDWEQGFRRAAGASTKPRIKAGAEYHGFLVPLRAGCALGGSLGNGFSIGSGLHLGAFHLDFAAVTGLSLSPGSSRGLNLAVSTGLEF